MTEFHIIWESSRVNRASILRQSTAIDDATIINRLLDEVILLCADCDWQLATRLKTILLRSPSLTSIGSGREPYKSALVALRMLVYLSKEGGQGARCRLDQIQACIQELVAWSLQQQTPQTRSLSGRDRRLH